MKELHFQVLLSDFKNQYQNIHILKNKIQTLKPFNEDKLIHLAYSIHNFYCSVEDLFKISASYFENQVKTEGQFHKELLRKMTLTIDTVRPNIISNESYILLLEILSFRHVFRHAYNYNLQGEKVVNIQKKIISGWAVLSKDFISFQKFIESKIKSSDLS